jgi:hypothetical protein
MKKYEQAVASLIVGGFVLIAVADTIKRMLWCLIILGVLLLIYRLLLGDR